LINKELGSRHSQNGRIHYSVFGKEFGRRKKCMLLLSEVDLFLSVFRPMAQGFLCETRNTFTAANHHSAVMVSAPQPQLEAQVIFGRAQLIV